VVALLLLGGCSTMEKVGDATASGIKSVASALNPFNWFGDDEPDYKAGETVIAQKPETPDAKVKPGDTRPPLSSVPDRPRRLTSARAKAARKEIQDGLAADAENARHTDQALRAGQPGARSLDSAVSPDRVPGAGVPVTARTQRMPAVPTVTVPTAAAPAGNATAVTAPADEKPGNGEAATRMAAAPPSQQASLTPRGSLRSVQVATIYFSDGSASLTDLDQQVVRQVAQVARRTGGIVRIIGHSSVGDPSASANSRQSGNYRVSLKRANAVAAELRRHGVSVDRVQVIARGDSEPVYLETAATGAAGNRRAEVYLDYFEGDVKS
jgi:flagellar motor protein MotB